MHSSTLQRIVGSRGLRALRNSLLEHGLLLAFVGALVLVCGPLGLVSNAPQGHPPFSSFVLFRPEAFVADAEDLCREILRHPQFAYKGVFLVQAEPLDRF